MGAVVDRLGKVDGSDRADRALSIAAGALAFADDFDQVFDMPDAEVGRLIKQKAEAFRRAVADLGAMDTLAHPLTTAVSLDLPVKPSRRAHRTPRVRDFDERGQVYRQGLVADKKLLTSGDTQKALAVTRQALSAAMKASRMFTVEVDGQTFYPGFFADGEVDRPVLEKISRALGNLPGWMKWDFFTAVRGSLGGISPLEALRKGKVEEVERLAQALVDEITR